MSKKELLVFLGPAAFLCMLSFSVASGPNFVADYVFKGSDLSDFKTVGSAAWKAQNGEIIGTSQQPSGGWLLTNRSFADVGFYASIRCIGDCKTGIMFRTETTSEGMKGIFISLSPGELGSYAITLDAQGKELSRKKLPASNTEGGLADPWGNISPENRKRAMEPDRRPIPLPDDINLPELRQAPVTEYELGGWNEVNIILYRDMVHPSFGAGSLSGGIGLVRCAASESDGSYGPIALYVGGTGEVHVKDFRYKDLNVLATPEEQLSTDFRMRHLNGFYFSWSTAMADVNHDGNEDVIAYPYYYLGPDFLVSHEIDTPQPYNPGTDYAQKSMVDLAADFTGDGWPDVLVMSGSAGIGLATLFVNPQGQSRHWDKHVVIDPVGNETTLMKDIDGDGKPEIIHPGNNVLRYSKPDPTNPTGPWITKTISEPGIWGAAIGHGLGVGDINGDGLPDYVCAYGWWEQPAKGSKQELWTYHPQAFGRFGATQGGAGGAEMGIYDVNGDGLNDVVTALEGHGFGLAWYEQKRDSGGKISFVQHIIMDNFLTKNAGGVTFTEPHAAAFGDMDGDGIPDMIVGKRAMSHLFDFGDPDPFGPAVLYIYKVVRDAKAPGGAEFVPALVHNFSGVGSTFSVGDLNKDGKPDIATSGVYGTFVFFNETRQWSNATRIVGSR